MSATQPKYHSSALATKASHAKYLVIGEMHPDQNITQLLVDLIATGKFGSIYIEGLVSGERKKIVPAGELGKTFGHTSKYDVIANAALESGMRVFGMLDKEALTHETYVKRTEEWLGLIKRTRKNIDNTRPAILLVGAGHVEYPGEEYGDEKDAFTDNIVDRLTWNGVARSDIVTVVPYLVDFDARLLLRIGELPESRVIGGGFEEKAAKRAVAQNLSDFVYTMQRGSC